MKAVMTNRNTGHRGLRAGRAAEFTRVMAPRLGAAPTVANGRRPRATPTYGAIWRHAAVARGFCVLSARIEPAF